MRALSTSLSVNTSGLAITAPKEAGRGITRTPTLAATLARGKAYGRRHSLVAVAAPFIGHAPSDGHKEEMACRMPKPLVWAMQWRFETMDECVAP